MPSEFMRDQVRDVLADQAPASGAKSRRHRRMKEYERLSSVYRPLVIAALEQPQPTPELRRHATRIGRELGLV